MKKIFFYIIFGFIIILAIALMAMHSHNSPTGKTQTAGDTGKVLQVVAAENFWGNLISQLGGSHVHVLSIISNPNVDPHEYETNASNARALATADYVILNGAGYDSWGDKLLSASPNSKRHLLKVSELLDKKQGDNPHFWYNPNYVNLVIAQMEKDLIAMDPNDSVYYQKQYQKLQDSLAQYQNRIKTIKTNNQGTPVASTEDIFSYLASAAGLDLVSPPEFIQAVAEGNDPPIKSVIKFQNQLKNKQVKALVYNEQTVTPLTKSMKKLATDQGIPVVGITETIQPANLSFQDWMDAQLISLQNALNSK